MKKIKISAEAAYVLSLLLISFAVAMTSAADLGVSMIVAPAYILSLRFPALSFGQAEYVIQGLLFVLLCLWMGRVRLIYLVSFATCLVYGALLDFWRGLIPVFAPGVVLPMPVRIVFLLLGMLLTTLAVALSFKAYIYPQVYDFFVKGLVECRGYSQRKFKTAFDMCFLLTALLMTLLFFGRLKGIGVGTVLMTVCNGTLLSFFSSLLDRRCVFSPRLPALASAFSLREGGKKDP